MRFVLMTEGKTEKKALREFLHRAVNVQLAQANAARPGRPVGILPSPFHGNLEYLRKAARKAQTYLSAPDAEEIIAVIGLLDLYGLPKDWQFGATADERCSEVKRRIEEQAWDTRFRQFSAVHETEAWLLSAPDIFPPQVAPLVRSLSQAPERVNLGNPPAVRIERAYLRGRGKAYRKVVDGQALFAKLDPSAVLAKCPYFKSMVDEMVQLALSRTRGT